MSPRPLLAVSTGPLWRTPLEEVFAAVRAVGGEAVEILVTQEPETQSPASLERLAQRHDLPIVAIHAPQLLLTRTVFTTDPLEKVRRTVELTRALGVRTIVLHPPFFWQVRYALWALHELEDAAAGSGLTITMENMYPIHLGRRRLAFHRFAGLDAMARFEALTLDTSHLAVSEEDVVDAYQRLADRVVHVHLSDNRGRGRDSHAPLGEGVLPLEDFLRALDPERVGCVSLEVDPGSEDRARLEEVLGRSLDVARRHLART